MKFCFGLRILHIAHYAYQLDRSIDAVFHALPPDTHQCAAFWMSFSPLFNFISKKANPITIQRFFFSILRRMKIHCMLKRWRCMLFMATVSCSFFFYSQTKTLIILLKCAFDKADRGKWKYFPLHCYDVDVTHVFALKSCSNVLIEITMRHSSKSSFQMSKFSVQSSNMIAARSVRPIYK